MTSSGDLVIHGSVGKGFEPVREAFVENFTRRNELGGACCVYRHGEKVVDLWGGVRDPETGTPWKQDTMVLVFSATKGMSAMVMALAHSRGLIDYEAQVADYWPEFAQNGKGATTVRQLLSHQAGLHMFTEPVDRATVADLDRLAVIMARQKPAWEPGTRYSYHAITLGFYENELIRRVDPRHRTLGQFFQDEIAAPLAVEFYIRLPEDIPNARLAPLQPAGRLKALLGLPFRFALAVMYPRSNAYKAFAVNPGTVLAIDEEHVYARNLEVPSGGGVGTAHAMARAYSEFATGGRELGLKRETLEALAAPAVPPSRGNFDECMRGEVEYSLGFMKSCKGFSFGDPGSYGAPGAGGSLGYADPAVGIGYGYVTNRMGVKIDGDPRDVALREALYSVLAKNG